MLLDIIYLILGALFSFIALFSVTVRKGKVEWRRKLTPSGWIALLCLLLTVIVGAIRENIERRELSESRITLAAQSDEMERIRNFSETAMIKLENDLKAQKRKEDALYKEARAHIKWAVKKDKNRREKYHEYKITMNKFDAVMEAQNHNPKAQAAISMYGQENTLIYIKEIE